MKIISRSRLDPHLDEKCAACIAEYVKDNDVDPQSTKNP